MLWLIDSTCHHYCVCNCVFISVCVLLVCACITGGVGLKIEIHEIHQNLQNPVSINRNPPSATKSTSFERKLIIEIQRCTYLLNRTNQLRIGSISLYPASMHRVTFLAINGRRRERGLVHRFTCDASMTAADTPTLACIKGN